MAQRKSDEYGGSTRGSKSKGPLQNDHDMSGEYGGGTRPRGKEKGGIKTTGQYKGKSNALGMGGRAQQMRDKGVPGGVIGAIARREGAAPGGPNFHGGKK